MPERGRAADRRGAGGRRAGAARRPGGCAGIAGAAGVGIGPAVDRFEARLAALEAEGIDDRGALAFDAAFGRNLEYYDGFVFELRAPGGAAHPPLAGGGRYDAMTVRLGARAPVPAVGGMIRPEAVLAAARGRRRR